MLSHPVKLDVQFFGRTHRLLPYFMCVNSEGSNETARMRWLTWAFAGCLWDKYYNLMSWLKFLFELDMSLYSTDGIMVAQPVQQGFSSVNAGMSQGSRQKENS